MWPSERKVIIKSILWTLILTTIAEGFDIPNRVAIEQTARVLKAQAPETLSIKYHGDQNGEVVEVILKKVLNTIPSTLLPIFHIEDFEDDPIEPRLNNFLAICYHGVNSYSAITYFPHTQTLHGVIDYRFYIENLPRIFADMPDVVEEFMHPMVGNELRPDQLPAQNRRRRLVRGLPMRDHLNCSLHRKYKETLYAEVLVIIDTMDHADHDNTQRPHEKSVMYALAYWNAVDMLFSHLKRTEIKINIAGIGVGSTQDVIHNMLGYTWSIVPSQFPIRNDRALHGVGSYLNQYRIEAPRVSYDFSIWMTEASLYTSRGRNTGGPDLGISSDPTDCGGSFEEEEEHSDVVSSRAVVMHDSKYSNYHTAARQLASLMFVSIDDISRPDSLSQGPSRGIMDPKNLRVEGCLRWSYQSEIDFFNYARSKSSCCLRNYPYRTMEMPSPPIRKLTLDDHCECYKMEVHERPDDDEYICRQEITCKNQRNELFEAGFPLDGTECQNNDGPGMCRHNRCVPQRNLS